jgi:hypothetical protein
VTVDYYYLDCELVYRGDIIVEKINILVWSNTSTKRRSANYRPVRASAVRAMSVLLKPCAASSSRCPN